ncbi:MAG: DUF58 domain-containing protein [Verrucomicrobiota bacterium]
MSEVTSPSEREQVSAILRKIHRIELKTRGLVRESFGGEYHSCFKGEGIDFDDFREYQHGDEVRAIDWHVTARLGTPYIKKFSEERELTVFIAVDISASGDYGSVSLSKRELAAEVAALLAFSALHNKDKVGLVLFTDEVEMYIPPKKGTAHVLRLIREILCAVPKRPFTDPTSALELLVRGVNRRSLVFLISDFVSERNMAEGLKPASIKHDLVGIRMTDPVELALPRAGRVVFTDAETGEQLRLDTSNNAVRERYQHALAAAREDISALLRSLSIDTIDLRTDRDYLPSLHSFFQNRDRAHA